ncbi:MAG: hypothetical protein LBR10_10845 [Prevotellaceae bacterium]|jgi:hypothetical protein|nr:hypothetical protein [Prevotellaceae bacterium]
MKTKTVIAILTVLFIALIAISFVAVVGVIEIPEKAQVPLILLMISLSLFMVGAGALYKKNISGVTAKKWFLGFGIAAFAVMLVDVVLVIF